MNPDLVARDEEGRIMSVRYEAVNAMLLNEFLKEHRKVRELEMNAGQQQKQIAAQQATIAQRQKQIEALTDAIEKVSDQMVAGKSWPAVTRQSLNRAYWKQEKNQGPMKTVNLARAIDGLKAS